MSNLINLIIPKANAQADAVAQPTFGNIDIGIGGGITGQVLLSSDKTSVEVGERFKIRVQINTNDVNIEEYRVVLNFDPTKLQVVDSDTGLQGVQVSQLDTVFSVDTPQTDNIANNNLGTVRYVASVTTPVSINTEVIEIEFQAQASGQANIQIVEGSAGTQLIRQAGQGLVYTPNQVSIDIAQSATDPEPQPEPQPEDPPPTTGQNGSQQPPTVIPDTSISNDLVAMLPVLVGLVFVLVGATLSRTKESKEDK